MCQEEVCLYYGTCLSSRNAYHCNCIAGLTGRNCEIGSYYKFTNNNMIKLLKI